MRCKKACLLKRTGFFIYLTFNSMHLLVCFVVTIYRQEDSLFEIQA